MLLIVSGVAGSGKSTVGRRLASRLNLRFEDADDFHPLANRQKMAEDIPLDDQDRWPWLEQLSKLPACRGEPPGAVLACSALRESYRKLLVTRARAHRFIFLELSPSAAARRLEARRGQHELVRNYDRLLAGQFRDLEVPLHAIRVNAELPIEEIVERAVRALGREGFDGAARTYLAQGSPTTCIDAQESIELVEQLLGKLGPLRRVLLVPPDFTRLHSGAGPLTVALFQRLKARGAHVELLPATGTHVKMSPGEREQMFPGVPSDAFRDHDFRRNLVHLGTVPGSFVREVSSDLVDYAIRSEVNLALHADWDRIISIGQLVPHEVIGIANHNKNIFVGVGGKDVIDRTHFLGAACNMERIMGQRRSPVRDALDYMSGAFRNTLPPITYLLTVRSKQDGALVTRGIYAGDDNGCFMQGAALAQTVNIERLSAPIRKAVVYLDPNEFKSTWLGNKAIYRTRLALADDAELLILAPGVRTFGEDVGIDRLIRRFGYRGTRRTLSAVEEDAELGASLSAAAHLIHGSSEGRFRISYAAGGLGRQEITGVGYDHADPQRALERYNPRTLRDGTNHLPDGEEIFFISNPALGLWATEARFATGGTLSANPQRDAEGFAAPLRPGDHQLLSPAAPPCRRPPEPDKPP